MDDFSKPDASPASMPTPKQPDQNQQTDFFAAGTCLLALFVVYAFLFSKFNPLISSSNWALLIFFFPFLFLNTREQVKRTVSYPHHHRL